MELSEIYDSIDCSGGRDACWPWTRARLKKPGGKYDYGMVRYEGKPQRVSRLLWTLWFGPIPEGYMVCHTCDWPPCCNWRHWFLGTNVDNMADMVAKGRTSDGSALPRGDDHWRRRHPEKVPRGSQASGAKFSDEQIKAIRQVPAYWGVNAVLAKEYGVSSMTISRIRRGEHYVTV